MQQQQRNGILIFREKANKMDSHSFDIGHELREGIDTILGGFPSTVQFCVQCIDMMPLPVIGLLP